MKPRLVTLGQASDISSLVNDLLGMQSEVQQYAPSLASQWGWLAEQGKLIVAGQPAKITADTWVNQYRSFFAALQAALPTQNQMIAQNFNQGVAQGGITEAEGTALQAGDNLAAGGQSIMQMFSPYIPWVIGALVVAIVVPPLLESLRE